MSAPYVLFEGLDLAGKSSAANAFARQAPGGPWKINEKALSEQNPIRQTAVALKKDERFSDETMGWLHYASFRADLDTFTEPTSPTVQESLTAFRSIAFHSVLGDKDLADAFKKHLPDLNIFSNAFLLTASIEARQERLNMRIAQSPRSVSFLDMLVSEEPKQFQEMEKHLFEALHIALPDIVVVDTVKLSREAVVDYTIRNAVGQPTLFDYADAQSPPLFPAFADGAELAEAI